MRRRGTRMRRRHTKGMRLRTFLLVWFLSLVCALSLIAVFAVIESMATRFFYAPHLR